MTGPRPIPGAPPLYALVEVRSENGPNKIRSVPAFFIEWPEDGDNGPDIGVRFMVHGVTIHVRYREIIDSLPDHAVDLVGFVDLQGTNVDHILFDHRLAD